MKTYLWQDLSPTDGCKLVEFAAPSAGLGSAERALAGARGRVLAQRRGLAPVDDRTSR